MDLMKEYEMYKATTTCLAIACIILLFTLVVTCTLKYDLQIEYIEFLKEQIKNGK